MGLSDVSPAGAADTVLLRVAAGADLSNGALASAAAALPAADPSRRVAAEPGCVEALAAAASRACSSIPGAANPAAIGLISLAMLPDVAARIAAVPGALVTMLQEEVGACGQCRGAHVLLWVSTRHACAQL